MQDYRVKGSLGYALVRAFRVANRASTRALLPYELSAEQAHILLVLWIEGPMKIGELQRVLALSSATLTGAIDRMEKDGLVRRVQDEADRRAWRVEPAPIDPRKRRGIENALVQMEQRIFSVLTARERKDLFRMLERVTEGEGV